MADYPTFDFTNAEVNWAGKIIAQKLSLEENREDLLRAYAIANNWREAHAYPMRSIRHQLIAYMMHSNIDGITSARLKRMQAIRGKLQRSPVKLHQFQDIGGCRVIVNTMQDIDVIVNKLKAHSRHQYRKDSNYIGSPKADGYRCHHLMFNFVGRGDADIFTGRRIEIQVRTRLQHAWATAVEGVGMFRGEYLKGSVGHDGWLELFRLASEEFATIEGAPYQNSGLSTLQRRKRLRELDSELQALNTLNNIRSAVEWTSVAIKAGDRPDYYLITFDNLDKTVSVSPYFGPKEALKSYGEAEANDNAAGSELNNVVLVQADKIEYLQEAYPNYFGDTKLFRNVLAKSIYGFNEDEFTLKMQPLAPARPRENPDMSWFRKWKRLS